jgi:hypothetical protein
MVELSGASTSIIEFPLKSAKTTAGARVGLKWPLYPVSGAKEPQDPLDVKDALASQIEPTGVLGGLVLVVELEAAEPRVESMS